MFLLINQRGFSYLSDKQNYLRNLEYQNLILQGQIDDLKADILARIRYWIGSSLDKRINTDTYKEIKREIEESFKQHSDSPRKEGTCEE